MSIGPAKAGFMKTSISFHHWDLSSPQINLAPDSGRGGRLQELLRFQANPDRFEDKVRPRVQPPTHSLTFPPIFPGSPFFPQMAAELLTLDGAFSDRPRQNKAGLCLSGFSLSDLPQVGPVLFREEKISPGKYALVIIFRDGSRLSFTIELNLKGIKKVGEESLLTYVSPSGELKTTAVRIRRAPGKLSTLEADLPSIGKILIALRFEEASSSSRRVSLVSYTENASGLDSISQPTASPKAVNIAYRDNVTLIGVNVHAETTDSGKTRYRWSFSLSNGDSIQAQFIVVDSSLLPERASLKRWSPISNEKPLFLTFRKDGDDLLINGQGYTLRIPGQQIQMAQQRKPLGAYDVYPLSCSVTYSVNPLFNVNQSLGDGKSPDYLMPTDETIRTMTDPPWDPHEVTLVFSGLVCSTPVAVEIKGLFMRGVFLPDPGHENQVLINDGKGATVCVAVSMGADGVQMSLVTREGKQDLLRVSVGDCFGFFGNEDQGRRSFGEKWRLVKIAPSEQKLPEDWNSVDEETHAHMSRLFSARVASWKNLSRIDGSSKNPKILRVTFDDGKRLYLQRFEEDGCVHYRWVNFGEGPEPILFGEDEGQSLGGISWRDDQGLRHAIHPWRSRWVLEDFSRRKAVFRDGIDPQIRVRIDGGDYYDQVTFVIAQKPVDLTLAVLEAFESTTEGIGIDAVRFRRGDGSEIMMVCGETSQDSSQRWHDLWRDLAGPPDDLRSQDEFVAGVKFKKNPVQGSGLPAESGSLFIDDGRWAVEWEPFGGLSYVEYLTVFYMERDRRPALMMASDASNSKPNSSDPLVVPHMHLGDIPSVASECLAPSLWQAGAFVMPSEGTRLAMRRAALSGSVQDGSTAVFEFLGDIHSKPGVHSAAVVFGVFNRDGEKSYTFYGWTLKVPMVFRDGRWIPDADAGILMMERRRPRVDPRKPEVVIGNRLITSQNAFRFRVETVEGRWSILLQEEDGTSRVIRAFHSLLDGARGKFLSPDFGLTFGHVTREADEQLRLVSVYTGAPLPSIPIEVRVQFDDQPGLATPIFGQPVVRIRSEWLEQAPIVLDLSPGYSTAVPGVFSETHLTHSDGHDVRVVMHHQAGRQSEVAGVSVQGKSLDPANILVERDEEGTIGVSFSSGDTSRTDSLQWRFVFEDDPSHFSVGRISLGGNDSEWEGVSFNPNDWTPAAIMQEREGVSIAANPPKMKPSRVRGNDETSPERIEKFPTGEPFIYVPQRRTELAAPEGRKRLRVRFEFQAAEGTEGAIRKDVVVPLEYDLLHQVWRPQTKTDRVDISIGNASGAAQVSQTSNRVWVISWGGRNFFCGNFYANETRDAGPDGRPIPVIWESPGRLPHRSHVEAFLKSRQASPGDEVRIPIPEGKPTEISVELPGNPNLSLTIASLPQPKRGGHFLVVRGPAQTQGGGDVAVRYYFPVGNSSAAFEIAGEGAYVLRCREGVETPHIVIAKTHPGAEGLFSPARAHKMVLLSGEGPQALFLIDGHAGSFKEDVEKAAKEDGAYVRRQLYDAMSGSTYEVLFRVEGKRRKKLVFLGLAVFSEEGITVVKTEKMETASSTVIRTEEGFYLSMPRHPGESLVASFHGCVLPKHLLLEKAWEVTSATTGDFSQAPEALEDLLVTVSRKKRGLSIDKDYYKNPDHRREVAQTIAEKLGIPRVLMRNLEENELPLGISLKPLENGQTSPRGPFVLVKQSYSGYKFEAVTPRVGDVSAIYFYDRSVPFTQFTIAGRRYVALEGPYKGVLFYWTRVRSFWVLVEITPPALRNALALVQDPNAVLPPDRKDRKEGKDEKTPGDADAPFADPPADSASDPVDDAVADYLMRLPEVRAAINRHNNDPSPQTS